MKEKVKVLFIWQPRDELKTYLLKGLASASNVDLIFPPDTNTETLLKIVPGVQIIVGWRPTRELVNAAEHLALFINPGVGVQHLIELFREVNRKRKVILVNGHGNTYFAAQHAVSLLLALMNKIIPHHNWMMNGVWRKGDEDAISIPLRDRRVGLLGYGAVNRKVHKFLAGFDLEFSVLRRTWQGKDNDLPGLVEKYEPADLTSFLSAVDTLIIAIPQTSQTTGMLKEKELRMLGPEGLLVNVARGSVIDQVALFKVLKNKDIACAAIDVWYDYHPKPDEHGHKYPFSQPFHQLDNVILSPHRAASPFSDLKRWDEVIENISHFSQGRDDFLNVVDLDLEY